MKLKDNILILALIMIFSMAIIIMCQYNIISGAEQLEYFTSIDELQQNMVFYDENHNIIDFKIMERQEQLDAFEYVDSDSVVLELGGRYGTVSCTINRKLSDPTKHLVVEPDPNVVGILKENKIRNNCKFQIFEGAISNKPLTLDIQSYGSHTNSDNGIQINIMTLDEIISSYNLNFNCLVADCEGCIINFYKENPMFFQQLKIVIVEKDQENLIGSYFEFDHFMTNNNFKIVKDGFHSVYKKI